MRRQRVRSSRRTKPAVLPRAASTFQRFTPSTVSIANRQRTKAIDTRMLKRIVAALFAELQIQRGELGIHLVGAREMAQVNWQYLQHEGSTDIITFDHSDGETDARSADWHLHGELFVCVDDAVAQAKTFRTTWRSEVVRYIVHGVLHLLGHDDMRADLRRAMKREENRLVRRLEKRFSLAQPGTVDRIRA